jgi:Der1-like family
MQNRIHCFHRTTVPTARAGGVQVGDATRPEQWFRSLPIITRYWFGAVVAVTLAANVGVVRPSQLMFHWPSITKRMELWRIVTSFLYMGPVSVNTVIRCYMLVTVSQRYERDGPFNTGAGGSTADYAFCLMFAVASILLAFPLFGPLSQLTLQLAGTLLLNAPPTGPALRAAVPLFRLPRVLRFVPVVEAQSDGPCQPLARPRLRENAPVRVPWVSGGDGTRLHGYGPRLPARAPLLPPRGRRAAGVGPRRFGDAAVPHQLLSDRRVPSRQVGAEPRRFGDAAIPHQLLSDRRVPSRQVGLSLHGARC